MGYMSKSILRFMLVLVISAVPLSGTYANTITFDEFPPNNNNVAITSLYAADGIIFGTDNAGTWGGNSNGNPGNWGLEGTNGPAFLGNNGGNNSGTYVTSIFFTSPVSNVSFDVSRSNGSSPGQSLNALFYDDSTLLGQTNQVLGNINEWSTFSFLGGGVDKVVLDGSQTGFSPYGVDNLQFNSSVPEPGSFLLLGIGLIGLVGFRKTFRKQ